MDRALLAQPGDPDLDCDVSGLIIRSVVVADDSREILLRGEGGSGRWTDTCGHPADVDRITDVDVSLRLPKMPDGPWCDYVRILYRWRDDSVPLRMTAAPGRVSLLTDDHGVALPIPRHPEPADQEAPTHG